MRSPADLFRRACRSLAALLIAVAFIVPTPALASGDSVWADCGDDGTVNQHHSQSDYTDALGNPPADAAEYTDCLDQIRAAQIRESRGGSNTTNGAGAAAGGGSGTGGAAASTVAPEDLSNALQSSGVDPAQPATGEQPAPEPVTVDGETVDLSDARVPSIAGALSLPLPLAASAIVVLVSAGLPLARYVVARFGGPPTGTTSAP